MKQQKPKILFYDIETSPLKAWVWRLGKQLVLHHQLVDDYKMYGIICISYCWNDNKKAKNINWGKNQDTSKVIKEFDKIIKQADITIGKNSDSFDLRHINSHRMLNNQPGMPDWAMYTDDVEKQIRKHFYLPSYSLNYFSELIGLGGKDKIEFQDWIKIVEENDDKSLKKMIKYCNKDVTDTRKAWYKILPHITPRFNMATFNNSLCCKVCGSKSIHKNGTRIRGKTKYQSFHCKDHGGYAGCAPISKYGVVGRIG